MWPNLQETAYFVTFTEEILNGKLHFLSSEIRKIKILKSMQKHCVLSLNVNLITDVVDADVEKRFALYLCLCPSSQTFRCWRKLILLWSKTKIPVTAGENLLWLYCMQWYFHNPLRYWLLLHARDLVAKSFLW